MGHAFIKTAAPTLAALGALGFVGSAMAGAAGASTTPTRPTHAVAATHKADAFDLRGMVSAVDAKTGRIELKVGKVDVAVAVKAPELKLVKVGDTVVAKGDIVHSLRTATTLVVMPSAKTAATAKAKAKAVRAADAFDLRGMVTAVDAKTGRIELKVGKVDVAVAVKAPELKLVKVGDTVVAKGDIVHNLRTATTLVKA